VTLTLKRPGSMFWGKLGDGRNKLGLKKGKTIRPSRLKPILDRTPPALIFAFRSGEGDHKCSEGSEEPLPRLSFPNIFDLQPG